MGKPLSMDLRERIIEAIEGGLSRRAAAQRFGVSESCAIKLAARVERTGSAAPAKQGRPPGKGKLKPFASFLTAQVDDRPDITMPELAEELMQAHGESAHPAALSKFLIRQGYSYKKNADRNRTRTRKGSLATPCVDRSPPAEDAT